MYKVNFILNFIIVIGLFVIDGITDNVLGLFAVTLFLLFPKIRGILLNKEINSNLMYEMVEFLINLYLLVIIGRALFDHSINFNDFTTFTYSYMIIRLLLINLIILLLNLLLFKSNNKKKKIVIDGFNFSYVVLFTSIFGMYFSLTKYSNFNMIVKIILCGLNIYFCFKLINELKYDRSGLYFSLIIAILGILLSNEILILVFIKFFSLTYNRDKIVFNK